MKISKSSDLIEIWQRRIFLSGHVPIFCKSGNAVLSFKQRSFDPRAAF